MQRRFPFFIGAIIVVGALLTLPALPAWAVTPQLINYQGVLRDGGGNPITIPTTVEFRIWDADAGGNELWMESQLVTPDANGLIAVLLGSMNPVPDTALGGAAAYLGITISPDLEMTPRARLVATAYAMRVNSLAGAKAGPIHGDLVLAPNGSKGALQDPGDPQIILVSTQGDSVFFGPADQQAFRAVDNVDGEYIKAYVDPSKGPLMGIRLDGTEYAEYAARSSVYYNSSIKGTEAFTKSMEIGRDGLFVYGASDTDTLGELNSAGLTVRDGSGQSSVVTATSMEIRDTGGGVTASVSQNGIEVFETAQLNIGQNNVSTGNNSIAVGTDNSATGDNAITIGNTNTAGALNGVAIGDHNTSSSIGGGALSGRLNVAGFYGVVAGGRFDSANGSVNVIGGGEYNATTNSLGVIGGGTHNRTGYLASIGGGTYNEAIGDSSVIGGGGQNSILGGATGGVIGGGANNVVSGRFGAIPGGENNLASGDDSFAAGQRAKAMHDGSFVWADNTAADFTSTGTGQFLIRASGGVGIGTDDPASALDVNGGITASGGYNDFNTTADNSSGNAAFGHTGYSNVKLHVESNQDYGVYIAASGAAVDALYVLGDASVVGTLSKGGGSFKIDHPLDPANKYLYHSFVESPDMMNVYNGNVILDASGNATVALPDYFEALNRDFRYQLTPVGAPGPNLYVQSEIAGGQFSIAGGAPGSKVSWQVTGIRQDAFANAHRIKVEEDKKLTDRGRYLYPVELGKAASMRISNLESAGRSPRSAK